MVRNIFFVRAIFHPWIEDESAISGAHALQSAQARPRGLDRLHDSFPLFLFDSEILGLRLPPVLKHSPMDFLPSMAFKGKLRDFAICLR